MRKILTASQMLLCDRNTIENAGVPSRELMERAARTCLNSLESGEFDLTNTVFVCGTGNNGGDGMAMAHMMQEEEKNVRVILVGDEEKCTDETEYRLNALRADGVFVSRSLDLSDATTIVDSIFGVGLTRNLEGEFLDAVQRINRSGVPVFSVDIPSGISADTGAIMGEAVIAKKCAVISNLKRGNVLYPGAEYCGEVVVLPIGISDDPVPDSEAVFAVEDHDLEDISHRAPYSNKGTFGRVLVIGGSKGMAGAPYFSALSAYRSGAGLCEIFTHEDNRVILQTLIPESIISTYTEDDFEGKLRECVSRATAVVIGPGLGMSELSRKILRLSFDICSVPMVCDADALNIVADEELSFPTCPVIVTPHLGEMSRLIKEPISRISANLTEYAIAYAREKGVVCLLKDARSVISDGNMAYVNLSGTSAMAKGGSGDVLAGVVAALFAQGISPIHGAVYGAFLHGRAGERAAERLGIHALLARDIADSIVR